MKTFVMDSFAMIAFFEDEPGAGYVAELLNAFQLKKAKGLMSVINWGEVYYNTAREAGIETAEKVMQQFDHYSIEVVDADQNLTIIAAHYKASHRLSYADCFAAALAFTFNAPVVTGDPEFKQLEGDIAVAWISTPGPPQSR